MYYDIKFALKKLYPWATEINYVSKKGKLNVDIEYRNPNRTRVPDSDECFLTFIALFVLHCFTSFLCLCFISNPILANALFISISVGLGFGACIAAEVSKGEAVIVWGINLILMLCVILCTWQFQAWEANGLPNTLPKFFSFLCKFKF